MENLSFNNRLFDEKPSLQNHAIKFTQNLDDANDLVQETLLKALRYSGLFTEGTNLRGWLYTIMKNTFINGYRKEVKYKHLVDTDEELKSYQLFKSASSNRAEGKFIAEDIYKALAKLEDQYCVPFMKYFEGFKYHEIAAELAIPIGTVKTRIYIARQLLKKNLTMYKEEFERTKLYN
ncbi:sigma-70 family RNA polymerase sigma factor [Pedobacter sp. L105]|uniref:sigma-70 family RNA polymerase sigma factor n=1 Tax=Pedobacter sp. L105 TaxID=1641871 RepID=UPI00131BC155|nr:sigma-70 family RNA polymerase sigma factor [Pedobacter sp. L105]